MKAVGPFQSQSTLALILAVVMFGDGVRKEPGARRKKEPTARSHKSVT